MLEALIVIFIFLVFLFPFKSLAILLGAGTTLFFYRGRTLSNNQPKKGKPLIWYSSITTLANFFLSLLVGGCMASLVHFFIISNNYLFLFNFAFCAIISLRWFDYTFKLYQSLAKGLKKNSSVPPSFNTEETDETLPPLFVMCQGMEKKTGFGLGMVPIFIDSGYLYVKENELFFDGVFLQHRFDPKTVSKAEKISSEKIKIETHPRGKPLNAEELLIILRTQFYPFKARHERDKIFEILSSFTKRNTQTPTPVIKGPETFSYQVEAGGESSRPSPSN